LFFHILSLPTQQLTTHSNKVMTNKLL